MCCNFGSEMVKNYITEKRRFVGISDLLLMGLGPDQQQHPGGHTGVSRWRVRGCGCWCV